LAVGSVLLPMATARGLAHKALPLVVSLALAGAAEGCSNAEIPQPAHGASPNWTSFVDSQTGLRGSFPSSWHRGPASLQPKIVNPRQLFTVATFPPRREPANAECGYLHSQEIREVGARGAFVTLFVGGANPKLLASTRLRPRRFRLRASDGTIEPPTHARQWIVSFKAHHRYFTAGVVIGKHAPRAVRQDARLVLDRLHLGELRLKS
jgi:hypothetical protein